jgi:O-methyltransferase domain/Dimerisation domain
MRRESISFPEARTQHVGENTVKARSPAQAMHRMAGGFAMTQVLHVAAQSGIADELGDEARSVNDVAAALDLDAHSLERFLRMMVVLDLLVQEDVRLFRLSAVGQLLRADHPESMRDRILYIGAISYPAASAALHSVRTGEPAFDHVFGRRFFDYLAEQPALGGLFNGLMKQGVHGRISSILQAYDFSRARRIVDIGGGNGALLSAVLVQAPALTGSVFDTAGVVAETRARLAGTELSRRIDLVEDDLFRGGYPQGADLYLLSNIIHDWNDAQAETILHPCVSAMPRDSSLLLIEELMPERVTDCPATIANDYSMLILTGGEERSEAQYRVLLDHSGLLVSSIIPFSVESEDSRHKGNWALLDCCVK